MKIRALNRVISPKVQSVRQGQRDISDEKFGNTPGFDKFFAASKNYNISFIKNNKPAFKGYYGDQQPAKKLFWIVSGTSDLYGSNYVQNNMYNGGNTGYKKWLDVPPQELLKFEPRHAIEALCTLNTANLTYPGIPSYIPTPDYGDKWGRRANYIEINPRTIARTKDDRKSEGLLNLIKLIPAIPPSGKHTANCIILSQLYPSIHNDGHNNSSLYTVNIEAGISKNLTSDNLYRDGQRMGDDELVKAFNDLSHYRGLKTGIRMPLSSGQIKVNGKDFNWYDHENNFINACCYAVDLGFDAIFLDSAKHIGDYDMGNYHGNGNLPNYKQMQYITQQIRQRTGRRDIALIGEKCTDDQRFKELGLTAGNDWGRADNIESLHYEYQKQKLNDEYAAGPVISDDNDENYLHHGQRLNRIKNSLCGFEDAGSKLPCYMQLNDIFPLTSYTSTHSEMENGHNFSTYNDVESNYNNTFDNSEWANNHRRNVYRAFLDVLYND